MGEGMANWVYDSAQSGLLTVFKDYEVEELKCLWGREKEASSREVWMAVNHVMGEGSISRASIINSLNRMVELGVLKYSEVTGKGGHRGLYTPALNEGQLKKFIESSLKEHMTLNLV
jgi:predicted transcriptional regulator